MSCETIKWEQKLPRRRCAERVVRSYISAEGFRGAVSPRSGVRGTAPKVLAFWYPKMYFLTFLRPFFYKKSISKDSTFLIIFLKQMNAQFPKSHKKIYCTFMKQF